MSRIFKVILLLFFIAPVIVILYDTLAAPKVLTRENNKGNEYEQLDRLMNTTRYAEQVRKAGYEVDDYDLEMMDRIPVLKTLGKNKLSIESPMDKTTKKAKSNVFLPALHILLYSLVYQVVHTHYLCYFL